MSVACAFFFIGIVPGGCLFTVRLVSTARCSFAGDRTGLPCPGAFASTLGDCTVPIGH